MRESISISHGDWGGFAAEISEAARGRPVRVEMIGGDIGAKDVVMGAPFYALDFVHSGGKGKFRIVTGEDGQGRSHTVASPAKLVVNREEDGLVYAVEIEERGGVKVLLNFD